MKNMNFITKSQTEQRLAIAESRCLLYEDILNRLDVGVHVIDKDQTTIVYNTTMGLLESADPKNVLGKTLLESMPGLNDQNSTLLTSLREGALLTDRKQAYTNATGKQVITVNSTTPVFLNGELVGAMEVAKDITYIQTLAETIADLQTNLTNRKKSADTFQPLQTRYSFTDIVGKSAAITSVKLYAERTARTSSNVLIFGETGTGKELFAQSIHNESPRRNNPFIAINCAALPEHLLESLLFGTTKGSFTGATDRPGFFEQAQGGTLLLDEINSMNLDLQAKLLRVLQEKCVRRVGAMKEIPVDVRVIATANLDPKEAIAQNRLRADLYYRLGVMTLHIPPLRIRPEDIDIYVEHFICYYNAHINLAVSDLSPDVREAFTQYDWPGNVRELQHAIEGAMNVIVAEKTITMQHLPPLFRSNLTARLQPALSVKPSASERFCDGMELLQCRITLEKDMITAALEKSNGNITHAAKALGMTRQVLQYKIRKYKPK